MSPSTALFGIKVASVMNSVLFVILILRIIDSAGLSVGLKMAFSIGLFVVFKVITMLLFIFLGSIKCPECRKSLPIEHKCIGDQRSLSWQLKINAFTPLSVPNNCPKCGHELSGI